MPSNNHYKAVVINEQESTLQIVEKDRHGRVYSGSKRVPFDCGSDAMKLSVTMHGYAFHYQHNNECVYREVI